MPMLRLSDVAIVRLIVAAIVSGHEALVRHYTLAPVSNPSLAKLQCHGPGHPGPWAWPRGDYENKISTVNEI